MTDEKRISKVETREEQPNFDTERFEKDKEIAFRMRLGGHTNKILEVYFSLENLIMENPNMRMIALTDKEPPRYANFYATVKEYLEQNDRYYQEKNI